MEKLVKSGTVYMNYEESNKYLRVGSRNRFRVCQAIFSSTRKHLNASPFINVITGSTNSCHAVLGNPLSSTQFLILQQIDSEAAKTLIYLNPLFCMKENDVCFSSTRILVTSLAYVAPCKDKGKNINSCLDLT